MFKVLSNSFSRYNNSIKSVGRNLSKDKSIASLNVSRSDRISSAVKLYVSRCNDSENLIAHERKEFEFGRCYLAKMMGADPESFNQNDINESIRYLFPSGLFSEEARPIMTDPANVYPKKKPLQCDNLGRPFNSFYYTGKPVYHSIMHEAVYLLEKMKSLEDASIRSKLKDGPKMIELHSSRWMNQEEFQEHCLEKIPDEQFKNWQNLMDKIYNHPYNPHAEQFLSSMRVSIKKLEDIDNIPKPVIDPATGRKYVESYGQKKWTMAEVKLFMPGSGKLSINGDSLLNVVPSLSDRECILFPLQFTNTVGKVDIEAHCVISGQSCLAYAMRLAVSRGLSCFLPPAEVTRLRLAGLLTQDERYRERKRPGQPKARKKAPWRPR